MPHVNKNVCINIIMSIRLAVGLYSEIFHKNIFWSAAAKAYCVFLAFICTIYNVINLLTMLNTSDLFIFCIMIIYKFIIFNSVILVSLFSRGSDIFKFLYELKSVPYTNKGESHTLISLLLCIILLAFNILRGIIYLVDTNFNNTLLFVTGFILLTNINLCYLTLILMFEVTFYRMRALRKVIENNINFSDARGHSEMRIQRIKLVNYLQAYKRLIDISKKYFGFSPKFLVSSLVVLL